ncbi:3-oxoacyl-ACP reductase [Rhodococcus sp. ACPA4]|nr:3-oxoacyl-ACP reductase [Rhodococcus sp. ACPA4]
MARGDDARCRSKMSTELGSSFRTTEYSVSSTSKILIASHRDQLVFLTAWLRDGTPPFRTVQTARTIQDRKYGLAGLMGHVSEGVDDWFEGKVAIVTGASRGIGRAVVGKLAVRGASVVLNGRDQVVLDLAVKEIEDAGGSAIGVQGDFADPEFPEKLIGACQSEFGRIDFVVNNAATSAHSGRVLDCGREAFIKTILSNTWPAVAIIQAAVAGGLPEGSSIVNISSAGAQRVHETAGVYTAGKSALESLTFTLSRELGPRGVTVNAIEPGIIKTDLAGAIWKGEREAAESRLIPMQRLGDPSDIANAVLYLLGPDARWVNGSVLRIDGGRFHVGGESAHKIGVFQ